MSLFLVRSGKAPWAPGYLSVIVGVVFRIGQDFFGPASLIFGYDPLVAALVPIAVCWLGGTWLLWRRA